MIDEKATFERKHYEYGPSERRYLEQGEATKTNEDLDEINGIMKKINSVQKNLKTINRRFNKGQTNADKKFGKLETRLEDVKLSSFLDNNLILI